MKQLILILLLVPFISYTQSSVPDKYWLDDSNFEEAIEGNHAFGDDDDMPIVLLIGKKLKMLNTTELI